MKVINPATGELLQTYQPLTHEEIHSRLFRTQRTQREWSKLEPVARAGYLRRVAGMLREKRDQHASLMAREMGKPIAQGRAEAEKCAWLCDYYADNGAQMLTREPIASDAAKSFVSYEPLGVIFGVMPWNFPFWQVFRFAVPALMAGNTVAFKPAFNVPGSALAIEELFADAGLPADAVTTLLLAQEQVDDVIRAPEIAAVSLTGSTEAGRKVAATAGSALKKTVLELGGSDPYLVLEDADLEAAAEICVRSRLLNSGQSCISAKRFIVVGPRARDFETIVIEKMAAARVGDPMDETTEVGPMAREDLRKQLHMQVQRSVRMGALLRMGGEIPDRPGFWYPPTVLTQVMRGMPAYDEELFGPVAAVIRAESEREGIAIANDTAFGLGACVLTKDLAHGEHIAEHELAAGCCFVNAFVRSDPRLPFGGIKDSGYGRELGLMGVREFVNAKTVCVYKG